MHDHERAEIVRRLFAVLTAMAEDTSTAAAEGQAIGSREGKFRIATAISETASQIGVIADAARELCNDEQRR